jgi:hypothetical protein
VPSPSLDAWLDDDEETNPVEIVVDRATGQARQAGATEAEGAWIEGVKRRAEASLYVFAKAILGRDYLTKSLHRPVCEWLQARPPDRKLLLLPREHCKTTIVAHALPLHILIQPRDHNVYFPGMAGEDQRVVLAGETDQRTTDALRVIKAATETNEVLRALWPHRVWDRPSQQALKWNDKEIILPRKAEWPDPSIRCIGVGGAVTGSHPSVLIKDDLVTLEAANSPTVMQTAITWHIASRALINAPGCLEYTIGTRWAVNDLYEYIQRNDPSVESITRAVVENGAPIYPQMFSLEKVAQLQREFGVLFPLLYMNSAADPTLVDFDMTMLRDFEISGGLLRFQEDDRDLAIAERQKLPAAAAAVPQGAGLGPRTWQSVYTAGEGFRLRG